MSTSTYPAVILFSIDGTRPDGILQAETPTIDAMVAGGASTMTARSVMPSVTLPCHTSMLRGVDVPRHGITSNNFQPLARPVPSLFDVAHASGRRTGFFYNWGELRDLSAPGSVDVSYMIGDCHSKEGDRRVANAAIAHMAEKPFDFLFVYLGFTDECGHANTWMSPPYIDAISHADTCIGSVVNAAQQAGRPTVTLVLSDHGGHERTHGTDHDDDMNIPWILNGPGVRAGYALTEPIYLYDTCTTLAAIMGLQPAREWDGRVVQEALS